VRRVARSGLTDQEQVNSGRRELPLSAIQLDRVITAIDSPVMP
jgi:hypothetical protein